MPFRFIRPRGLSTASLRRGPFYVVASVELGNTTTKCIIVATDLRNGRMYELAKVVRPTRDVRPPAPDEEVFGRTVVGVPLTRESVSEFVRDVLLATVDRARLDLSHDLHFVVRSTGVTAGFARPEEVGEMVKALADGCLSAGISPRLMTASLTPENLPPGIRDFTWLRKVYFDGAIAGCLPPADTGVVANEMEGELVTAGIKGAARSAGVDFRSPVITLDFGTTLAGRVTDASLPYAKTVGSFAGLAGAIPDALARGSDLVDPETGTALELPRPSGTLDDGTSGIEEDVERVHGLIRVQRVAKGRTRFGTVPVDPRAAEEAGLVLVGVDVGDNGSGLAVLTEIGREVYDRGGVRLLTLLIDLVQVGLVERIMKVVDASGLLLRGTSLGLTGRAILTGQKPRLLAQRLRAPDGSLWADTRLLVLVEDGLAMGAGVAARCMNSLGTPRNPIGGRRGDGCIMAQRMRLQGERRGNGG